MVEEEGTTKIPKMAKSTHRGRNATKEAQALKRTNVPKGSPLALSSY